MDTCGACGGRGWGLRRGFVRRCDGCCRFDDHEAAREHAEKELAHLSLPDRPRATLDTSTGLMRCPWCGHAPTNEDIDTFWMLTLSLTHARARVGRAREDGCLVLFLCKHSLDQDSMDDFHLECPKCRRGFSVPEDLDYDDDPAPLEWDGRNWVSASARPTGFTAK